MFECLMLDWVRGAWVVHVGVLNLPRIQAFSKPALWHFAVRLLKLIQKIERLCVCSLLLIPCHSNSSCLAERPFCFTFFSGSRCAPPYVPQHLASAGRTAAHPSCRWNYHHPRRVGTNFVDLLPWNFFLSRWCCHLLANHGMNRYSQPRFLAFDYIWLPTLPGRCLTAVLFAGSLAGGTLRCLVVSWPLRAWARVHAFCTYSTTYTNAYVIEWFIFWGRRA